jgi:predicted transcriptional regulator
METLGALLARLLRERSLSPADFAEKVKMSDSMVRKVISGKRAVEPAHAELWCKVLGLSGHPAQRLVDLIHLSVSTPVVREMVATLQWQVARLEREKRA